MTQPASAETRAGKSDYERDRDLVCESAEKRLRMLINRKHTWEKCEDEIERGLALEYGTLTVALARLRAAPPDPFEDARKRLEAERPGDYDCELRRTQIFDSSSSDVDRFSLRVWHDESETRNRGYKFDPIAPADLPRAVDGAVAVMRKARGVQDSEISP